MSKWKVRLCANCIKDLDDYYPYVVPRDQLDVTEVPESECDNKLLGGYNERLSTRNADYIATHRKENH